MAEWPLSGVSWSKLMFIESEIVISTMTTLMEKYQAPCFPVHDALLVTYFKSIHTRIVIPL